MEALTGESGRSTSTRHGAARTDTPRGPRRLPAMSRVPRSRSALRGRRPGRGRPRAWAIVSRRHHGVIESVNCRWRASNCRDTALSACSPSSQNRTSLTQHPMAVRDERRGHQHRALRSRRAVLRKFGNQSSLPKPTERRPLRQRQVARPNSSPGQEPPRARPGNSGGPVGRPWVQTV